jgi:hypothetical protein
LPNWLHRSSASGVALMPRVSTPTPHCWRTGYSTSPSARAAPAGFGFACFAQVTTRFFRGDLARAEEHFARWSGFLDADGFRQVPGAPVAAIGTAALCAGALGHADLARERIAQALAFARDSNNPYDLAFARTFESWLSCLLRESQRTEVAAMQALAIIEEHGFRFVGNLTRTLLGWAQAQLGRAGEGITLIRQGFRYHLWSVSRILHGAIVG